MLDGAQGGGEASQGAIRSPAVNRPCMIFSTPSWSVVAVAQSCSTSLNNRVALISRNCITAVRTSAPRRPP